MGDAMERTRLFTERLILSASCLPEADEIREYLTAVQREHTVSALFSPVAYMAASRRMDAMAKLARAALPMIEALEELREVTSADSNPELDQALAQAHRATMDDLAARSSGGGRRRWVSTTARQSARVRIAARSSTRPRRPWWSRSSVVSSTHPHWLSS